MRPLTWDQIIVIAMSLIGLSFKLTPPPPKSRELASPSQIIDLGCLDSQAPEKLFFQKQSQIRFKGRLCSDQPSGRFHSSLKIVNLSSGKTGVVFIQEQDRQFLTTELPLISGNNSIQIEWQDSFTDTKKIRTAQVFNEPI